MKYLTLELIAMVYKYRVSLLPLLHLHCMIRHTTAIKWKMEDRFWLSFKAYACMYHASLLKCQSTIEDTFLPQFIAYMYDALVASLQPMMEFTSDGSMSYKCQQIWKDKFKDTTLLIVNTEIYISYALRLCVTKRRNE